jgi:quinol monooxygenase YgiN
MRRARREKVSDERYRAGLSAERSNCRDASATDGRMRMSLRSLLGSSGAVLALSLGGGAAAEETPVPFVRIAELEIDPAQLESYKAAVKEEMETSICVEPGVLAIYAVAEAGNPSRLRFFEMYADEAAYEAHVASPHFRKYFETTKGMIASRKLLDTVPVLLSAKKNPSRKP